MNDMTVRLAISHRVLAVIGLAFLGAFAVLTASSEVRQLQGSEGAVLAELQQHPQLHDPERILSVLRDGGDATPVIVTLRAPPEA
jgi:hypothetical protein